jgi:hypothetical protein
MKFLPERTAETERVQAALREREAEAESLRLELERYNARFNRLLGFDKFCAKQMLSLRKRRVELLDLLIRVAVGLGFMARPRRLRRERMLISAARMFDAAVQPEFQT